MLKFRMFAYKSLLIALLGSFFIYSQYFGMTIGFLNTIAGLVVVYMLMIASKKVLFTAGFFTGILWFWWIGYSFIYYELVWMIPLILIGIGIIYGTLFYLLGLSSNLFYKILYLYILSYLEPFGFNWFKIEHHQK
jgi:apolipoprotein N-acyltransferase